MSWLDTLEDIRTKDFSKAKPAEREKAARTVINLCSYACAAVAVSPIPFSDAIVMLPIQSAMVITVGHIFGRKVTSAAAKDLILELGATAGIGMLARQGLKALMPIIGALLTIPAAFAANWAMGRVAIEYFKHPGASHDRLKQVYADAKREAGELFSREAFEKFRKGQSEGGKKTRKKASGRAAKKKAEPDPVSKIVEGDFAKRVAAHPEVADAVKGIVHLDVSGEHAGQWTIDLRKSPGEISPGLSGKPRLTVRADSHDFIGLVKRQIDPQTALLTGELKLDPMDLSIAAQLGQLFA
jgi:uncharacterized protein (DUF697 family)